MADKLKCWQPFKDRVRSLKLHMQFIDAAICIANVQAGKRPADLSLSAVLDKPNYEALHEKNTTSNRKRIVAFSRSRLHERVIVDIYKYFSDYVSQIIREIIQRKPTLFLSDLQSQKQRDISFADIIKLGSYDAVFDEMAKRVYRGLEKEHSTKKLLDRFIKVCKITVSGEDLQTALLYLEIRHLIIHNKGKVDESFQKLNTDGLIKVNNKGKIKMDYRLSSQAIYRVFKLATAIKNQIEVKLLTTIN